MKDLGLSNICKRIFFNNKDADSLIFVTAKELIQYNFRRGQRSTLYNFPEFEDQPEFFIFNED